MQNRLPATIIASVLAATSLLGCSDVKKDMTENDFCAERARRECEKIGPICGLNVMQCQAVRTTACLGDAAEAHKKGWTFHAENTEGCLNTVSSTYDKHIIMSSDWRSLADACAHVFQGPVKELQTCAADSDCEAPFICDKHLCAKRATVGSGDLCGNPGQLCPDDEYCKQETSFWKCTKRFDVGAACGDTAPCLPSLMCSGSCTMRKMDGQACNDHPECQSGYCNPYPAPGSPRKCIAGLSFGTDSPSCNAYFGVTGTPVVDAATPVDAVAPTGGVDAGASD